MGQPFRLLVTGSRTWRDIPAIEWALTVILARHPEGVLLVHGACPRGADAIAAASISQFLAAAQSLDQEPELAEVPGLS